MCGICGFSGPPDTGALYRMASVINHRGPDFHGVLETPEISLAHTRLSIIDLSSNANQPLSNEDGTAHLVYNGEIYNYRDLREELIYRGHRFKSQTDSEVIIHLYEDLGEELTTRLNGMYAFAVWDGASKTLLLARDPAGIKPLYYTTAGGKLIFSSEIKSLLAHPEVSKEIDPIAIDGLLAVRYLPGEKTPYKKIMRLPPGGKLIHHDGEFKLIKAEPLTFTDEDDRRSLDDMADEYRRLLMETLKDHLNADVPVGLHLSGGVDSATLLAGISRLGAKVHTFSIGFGTKNDEHKLAEKLAGQFGTVHESIIIGPEHLSLFEEIAGVMDDPVLDPILLPLYVLYRESKKTVKVVLTGEGADETLGGYIHHRALNWWAGRGNSYIRAAASGIVSRIPPGWISKFFPYPAKVGARGRDRLASFLSSKTPGSAYLSFAHLFTPEERKDLYNDDFLSSIGPMNFESEFTEGLGDLREKGLPSLLSFDAGKWLPDYTMLKQDRISMAHSLEGRYPYLDGRLVEFCLSLPPKARFSHNRDKSLLRHAAAAWLPEAAYRKKQAFYFPAEIFLSVSGSELFKEILSPERIKKRGIFKPEKIIQLIKDAPGEPLLLGKQVFGLAFVELWLQKAGF